MRILISAVNFNEGDRMASQRPRALAQLLAARGHDVTVLTMATAPQNTAPHPDGVEVLATVPYDELVTAPVSQIPLPRRILAALSVLNTAPTAAVLRRPRLSRLLGIDDGRRKKAFADLNNKRQRTAVGFKAISEDRKWTRESVPFLEDLARNREPYDVVWATYSTYGSLWLGQKAKSLGVAKRVVVDFRDLMNQPDRLSMLNWFTRRQQRSAVRKADAVTVVSQGLRENLLEDPSLASHAPDVHVLYNGFLPGTLPSATGSPGEGLPLKIVYTGSLYQGRRDASPLFSALREATTADPSLRFEVHYAGGAGALLTEMARKQGMEHCVVDHGVLTREGAAELQRDADLLLALSWNVSGSEGILTGKFPEYLGVRKPIISIVAGDIPNAELSLEVKSMNLGIAVEETDGPEGIERLTHFLTGMGQQKAKGEALQFEPDEEKVARHDYSNLTRSLEDLFQTLIEV